MQHAYWELKREMTNLYLVTQVQAELLRKLKAPAAARKGKARMQPRCSGSSAVFLIRISSAKFDKPKYI